IKITITNNETGENTGIYYPESKTGQYLFIAPHHLNNNITFEAEGYLFHSENVDISRDTNFYKLYHTIELAPVTAGSKDVLNNIFFENDKTTLSTSSLTELNNLFAFLTDNPTIKIEISTTLSK